MNGDYYSRGGSYLRNISWVKFCGGEIFVVQGIHENLLPTKFMWCFNFCGFNFHGWMKPWKLNSCKNFYIYGIALTTCFVLMHFIGACCGGCQTWRPETAHRCLFCSWGSPWCKCFAGSLNWCTCMYIYTLNRPTLTEDTIFVKIAMTHSNCYGSWVWEIHFTKSVKLSDNI